jgi:DNA invertase Pin-like site-specific DNA recombinase
MMIYGYVRVSTNTQTVENQKFEMANFCKKQNMKVDLWIEESISGTKAYQKRRLGLLLKKCKKNDILLCTELSRLGRSLFMIMDILNLCMQKGIKVWTIKEGYRLGEDIQSKVLAFAFGLSAEIERNLISQRTKECLTRLKAEGRHLGRPVGSHNKTNCVQGREMWFMKCVSLGMKKRELASRLGVSINTVRKYERILTKDK